MTTFATDKDETMTATPTAPTQETAPRGRRTLVTILVLVVGLSAFGLSFMVLRDLAALAGIPEGVAWLWPVIVDGTIAVTTLAAYLSTNSGAPSSREARSGVRLQKFTLLLFVIISVVGNVAHILIGDTTGGEPAEIPWGLAVFVAAVPPVGLFLSFELLVAMLRTGTAAMAHADAATTSATPATAPAAPAMAADEALELVPSFAPAPAANDVSAPAATAIEPAPSAPAPLVGVMTTVGATRTESTANHADAPSPTDAIRAVRQEETSAESVEQVERTAPVTAAQPVEHAVHVAQRAEPPAQRPDHVAHQTTTHQMTQSEVVDRALSLIESGASKRSAAEQLGVAPTTLTRWIKAARDASSSAPAPDAEPALAA